MASNIEDFLALCGPHGIDADEFPDSFLEAVDGLLGKAEADGLKRGLAKAALYHDTQAAAIEKALRTEKEPSRTHYHLHRTSAASIRALMKEKPDE